MGAIKDTAKEFSSEAASKFFRQLGYEKKSPYDYRFFVKDFFSVFKLIFFSSKKNLDFRFFIYL